MYKRWKSTVSRVVEGVKQSEVKLPDEKQHGYSQANSKDSLRREKMHKYSNNVAVRIEANCQDSTLQDDYESRRADLLREEKFAAWDNAAIEDASSVEIEAVGIVRKLRENDRVKFFGNLPGEAIPGPKTLDMGGQFLTNRVRIENSDVYQIAQRAPKGCQLHIHFNTELQAEELLRKARDLDTMYIRSSKPLIRPEDYETAEIVFDVLPDNTESADIFDEKYEQKLSVGNSSSWMKWKEFRKKFKQARYVDAEDWVQSKIALTEEEVYGPRQTLNGIWARFNQGTRCVKGLLNYESVFRWYIGAAIDSLIRDRVLYAEMRPMLLDKSISTDDGRERIGHVEQMEIIEAELSKKKKQLQDKGELHRFPFGFKVIYCTPRSISKECMKQELQNCINLKIAFPQLICGFDLVGAEDRPNPIRYYRDEMLAFVETCKNMQLSIPFMFHAGETLLDTGGSKNPENSNLFEALLLNSKRIGHGLALVKHPVLLEKFKERRICIELCPISNEILHLCRNIKEHPYPQLLNAGIPCTINTDNPVLFRKSFKSGTSLSNEFYQVMVGNPTMTIHGWRQLAEWSIEFSCLNEAEKTEAMALFRKEWEKFCTWIVHTYGLLASKLEDL